MDRDLTAPRIYDGGVAITKMTIIPNNYNDIRAEIVELPKGRPLYRRPNVNSITTTAYWEIGGALLSRNLDERPARTTANSFWHYLPKT
jgi:hypothetical protein